MAFYAVNLLLKLGDCEKTVTHAVCAETEKDAGVVALYAECHTAEIEDVNVDELRVVDMEYEYFVKSVFQITEEEYAVLNKYI